ncbi:hypothetical protein [Neolewinella persica]|uniref:hypothetical protein n=1 Tax=Neolewinella persica TaxID=70998 RepID=UPI0003770F95|nr:hypothetical protein [Neolewinella persica]
MPILTQEEIVNLRTHVREAIIQANQDHALELLSEALPVGRAKHNQVVILKSRQSDIVLHTVNNTLSEERLDILRNNLNADILLFIDNLTTADFEPKPAHRPGLKPGHLLYQVPTNMILHKSYDCLVRIAEELNQVLEGLAGEENLVIEDIGLSEVMEVEILDPGGTDNPVFNIMLLSDGEQVVDAYSYTEWVFNVRPLQEGEHQLILKISVLLTINGKERAKNVILRRPISIVAEAAEEAPPAKMRRMIASENETKISMPVTEETEAERFEPPPNYEMFDKPLGSGAPPEVVMPAPVPSPAPVPRPNFKRKPKRRSFLSLAATFLLLVVAGVWLVQFDGSKKYIEQDPNVGEMNPDSSVYPMDTIKGLQVPKRLLPDSLELGEGGS